MSPWNPLVQLGQYAYANTQFQPFYPFGLALLGLFPNTIGYNLFILTHYAMAGLFCYLYCRSILLTRYASFASGLFFMCSGFMLAHKGHQAMLSAAVWLPLILLFLERYGRRRMRRDLCLASIGLALSILAGFPQITVYSMLVAAPYLVVRMNQSSAGPIIRNTAHALSALIAMAVLACALSSLQIFAVAQALPNMTRAALSYAAFNEDSLPIYHVAAFFIPNIWGGLYRIPTYSPEFNFVEVYPYMGLLPIALSLLAFEKSWRKSGLVLFWSAASLAALILAFGLPPLQYILYRVPIYNLFRASCRHIFEVDFSLCILAGFGLNSLFPDTAPEWSMPRVPWRTITLVVVGLLASFGFAAALRHVAEMATTRPELARLDDLHVNPFISIGRAKQIVLSDIRLGHPTILYPIIFGAGALILLVLCGIPRFGRVWKIAVVLFFLTDVWSTSHLLYGATDTAPLYDARARPEIAGILNRGFDRSRYRIYPVDPELVYSYPLLNMMYGIGVINDYTPMWLNRYQAMTGFRLNGGAPPELLSHVGLMSLTGAQYLLAREPGTIEALRAPQKSVAAAGAIPLAPLTCADLLCASAAFYGTTISLASPDGAKVAIVNFPIQLNPEANYQVSFDADAGERPSAPLSVNLYAYKPGGLRYDNPGQYRAVSDITSIVTHHALWINSGSTAPKDAFVRFYTQSRVPIHIGSIRIFKSSQSVPAAYTEIFKTPDGISVFKNDAALPRFHFVAQAVPTADFDHTEAIVLDPDFDPGRQAVVEGLAHRIDLSPGRILSEEIHNNRMRWTLETGDRSLFVVDDSWFPGWFATVDGRRSKIENVDGFLRGVFIGGAGRHSLEIWFWPSSLTYGLIVTACGIAAALYMALKKAAREQ